MAEPRLLLYAIAGALALIYFPYLFVAFGRFQVGYDMSAPRALFDKLPPYAQRATWAHQNSFEGFGLFAAAALMVYVTQSSTAQTGLFALAYLGCRLGFSIFYIANVPILRSLMWAGSMTCIAGLIVHSLG